nr:immunoglobulin heavy chain junction region [Macaca mulatta]MOV43846.1 immunoglobulin heavy chain junction region [Macaca mulatta]
CARKDDDFDYW